MHHVQYKTNLLTHFAHAIFHVEKERRLLLIHNFIVIIRLLGVAKNKPMPDSKKESRANLSS